MDRPAPQYHFDGEEFRPFTYDDLVRLMERVRYMCWEVELAKYAHSFPLNHCWEEVPNGQ